MDMAILLTAIVSLVTSIVGLVTTMVTAYRELYSRTEKNPSPSQPEKDSKDNN
ncbi:hypothetical protein KFZ58_15920 [Virgibacillus sp. NKC19-16]|uniref:hypothetical protein n=1 Tax=Virgibacillus salidurans TaxID=2831673 RepID=UPI001F45EC4C|nr:hypothetical protein [Virgibacillus sp. NKC19-16]UJL45849.1 hypothetical protein KFZ58_15920 [Virgibacillus sp. NKC19-16]